MTTQELNQLLVSNFDETVKDICQEPEEKDVLKWRDQYNNKHDIDDKTVKPDKDIKLPDGTQKTIKLNRLPIPLQKKIVDSATAFLFGKPINFYRDNLDESGKPGKAFEEIRKVWKDQKLDSVNKRLSRRLMSETMTAELWFVVIKEENGKEVKRLKVKTLSQWDGDRIYPYFDEHGDLIAFSRKYALKDDNNENQNYIDVFTDKLIIVAKEENGKYTLDVKPNVFGKIPIVYYDIDKPAWYYVQRYIDRLEKLYSGHADTNDYFGSPALKLKGPIENPPDKDTAGKIFQFKAEIGQDGKPAYGDMEYLTWPLAPESIKMEIDNLKDVIYSLTSTPDLSFNNIKGVGNLSGLAIKLMFMDAEMNAMNYQEIFDEGLTRRFSLLKSMLSMLNYASKAEFDNLEIDFQFGSILPKDEKELIEMLSTARMGKALISERTAAKNVPFVDDVDKELEEMDAESEKEAQRALQITESFNPPADQNEDNQE